MGRVLHESVEQVVRGVSAVLIARHEHIEGLLRIPSQAGLDGARPAARAAVGISASMIWLMPDRDAMTASTSRSMLSLLMGLARATRAVSRLSAIDAPPRSRTPRQPPGRTSQTWPHRNQSWPKRSRSASIANPCLMPG